MKPKLHKVFVYGTLKKGFYFHDRYLGNGKSNDLGPVKASKDYTLYIDGMPHLVREAADVQVKGELYEVDGKVLLSLDNLWAPVYRRDVIEVFDESGFKYLAWAYLRPKHFKGVKYAHKDEEFL